MSAIKVNNFPFRGINNQIEDERNQRNFKKEVAFSYSSTKTNSKLGDYKP